MVQPPPVSDLLFAQQHPGEIFREGTAREAWTGVQMHLGQGVKAPLPSKWNGWKSVMPRADGEGDMNLSQQHSGKAGTAREELPAAH